MPDIVEFGIVGMGPAGIGLAMSLRGTPMIKNAVCFECGSYYEHDSCGAIEHNECCQSNNCSVISRLGGASTLSSGKISNFPAGSGLTYFYDSECQLREQLDKTILDLSEKISLKKVQVDEEVRTKTTLLYAIQGITYKYYDVYQFDGDEYRTFVKDSIEGLKAEGLSIFDNTHVTAINRDTDKNCFCIKANTPKGECSFFARNIVIATGALDIKPGILDDASNPIDNCYEIGVRIEAPNGAFGSVLTTHGDLKLKYGKGRTYCVTINGKTIVYQTDGMRFLEGCMDAYATTGYTNLAILTKCDDKSIIIDLFDRYRKKFAGIPVQQKLVDYFARHTSDSICCTTIDAAINGDINELFPESINNALKDFLNEVVIKAMEVPANEINIFAPELKLLRKLNISKNFELAPNMFVIGSATGMFRGILQSFCSGMRCGELLVRR